jgi:hypothetical protein
MIVDPHVCRSTLLAIALGMASIPIQSFLFEKVSVVVPIAEWLVAHDLKEHIHAIVRISDAIFWVCVFGIGLGVPLGLMVRTHIFRYWLIYVASQLSLYFITAFWSEYGPAILLVVMPLPTYWYNALGVLCFSYVAVWGRARFMKAQRVAP